MKYRLALALALGLGALVALPRAAAQSEPPKANTTVVPSSECAGIWQDQLDAGNCSRSACTSTCLNSLAQVRQGAAHPLAWKSVAVQDSRVD